MPDVGVRISFIQGTILQAEVSSIRKRSSGELLHEFPRIVFRAPGSLDTPAMMTHDRHTVQSGSSAGQVGLPVPARGGTRSQCSVTAINIYSAKSYEPSFTRG